jgi:hypothetical protein
MVKAGLITGVTLKAGSTPSPCRPCIVAKAKRLPVNKIRLNPISKCFGDLVYSDVWGPATTRTIGHALYFVLFIDDHTRWIIANLMRLKSLVFTNYCHFEAWAKTQFGANIKTLQSDKGGEYCSTEFENHCKTSGTVHRFAVHDVHQHNGVAEHANYTLLDGVRAVLAASGLPTFLWGEALNYIVWIRNRSPTKALDGKTPYEALYGHPPSISGLHEWGSLCWVARKHSKLADRADEGRWIGPDNNSKGQRIYWPDRRSITVEFDVRFIHAPDPLLLEGEIEDRDPLPVSPDDTNQPEPTPIRDLSLEPPRETTPLQNPQSPLSPLTPLPKSLPPSPKALPSLRDKDRNWSNVDTINLLPGRTRSSARIVDKPTPEEMNELHLEGELTANSVEIAMAAMTAEAEGLEPRSVKELKGRPDKVQWEDAMKDEIDRLTSRGTWKAVKKPSGANVIGSKWVFRLKKNANGEIQAYRARLVAQGNYQIDGVDVFDTFSPVARLAAIRTVLALAARLNWEIHQVDVRSAYLYGELTPDEVIYLRPPPGIDGLCKPDEVLLLSKALYGLKQSGRRWYQLLTKILGEIGLKRCEVDHAVFYRHTSSGTQIISAHVDDLTIAANTPELISEIKEGLKKRLEITDMGEIHWLLGIEIRRNRDSRTISLSQRSYIESIISRYNFDDARPLSMPMDPSIKLSKNDSPRTAADMGKMRNKPYREAVGSLMYASTGTRPDITYAVGQICRFGENPGIAHWEAVRRIFCYLKGTKDLWLVLGAAVDKAIVGYTDADGMSNEDRHAISGYVFLVDGGAVSWSSKRQELVTLSTTEAEYVAATHAAKEAVWLRAFISEVFQPINNPLTLYSDNQSAIALTKNDQFHARTKHIDIRFHYIRYIVADGKISLIYCPTNDMVADTLTKALPSAKAKHFAAAFGLRTL